MPIAAALRNGVKRSGIALEVNGHIGETSAGVNAWGERRKVEIAVQDIFKQGICGNIVGAAAI